MVAKLNESNLCSFMFGAIGRADTTLGIVDDAPALNAMCAYSRKYAPLGSNTTGGIRITPAPRQLYYVNDTIDMIDLRLSMDWGGSEFRPMRPDMEAVVAYESAHSNFTGMQGWADHLDQEAVLTNELCGIWFSKGQPIAITSETPFSKLSRNWFYNFFNAFYLKSQDTTGGLIWQSIFEQCLCWNSFDYGFYLWSVSQVSTTTTLQGCHTKSVSRAAVQRGGKVFRALQHMLSSNPIEPEVTAGWENYWLLGKLSNGDNEVPTTQPEWASGTFYRTCGKGYFVNNVQTISLINCSADGGVNFEEGNVLHVFNSHVVADTFHLEGTNINFADKPPIIIDSDMDWGWLYLFDQRIQMQNVNDRCHLFGGSLGRERNGSLSGIRNQAQNATRTGRTGSIRLRSQAGQDWLRFKAGIGVPNEDQVIPGEDNVVNILGKEFCRTFTSDRANPRYPDMQLIMGSTANYYKIYEAVIPATGEPSATFIEYSDLIEVSLNSGNDDPNPNGQYAKLRISAFVQSGAAPDKSFYDLEVVGGSSGIVYSTFINNSRLLEVWIKCKANGQAVSVTGSGKDGFYDVATGKQRLLYATEARATATVEAQEGFAEVPYGGGSADEWIEAIPTGSYTASSTIFTLPNGKVQADIKEVRVVTQLGTDVVQVQELVISEAIDTGTNPVLYVGTASDSSASYSRVAVRDGAAAPTKTTIAAQVNGVGPKVHSCHVKYN